jgi:hypothetical protein
VKSFSKVWIFIIVGVARKPVKSLKTKALRNSDTTIILFAPQVLTDAFLASNQRDSGQYGGGVLFIPK